MYDNVIFYSPFHNGDLHVSRTFVREIVNNIESKDYYYAHECHERVLSDIPKLKYKKLDFTANTQVQYEIKNNNLYVNTWVGQCNFRYFNGCTFTALYNAFSDMFKSLGISMKSKDEMLPYIEYSKFNIYDTKLDILSVDKPKIFLCNCKVLAYQSDPFDFDPIIDNISNKYKDCLFFITNDTLIKKENIILTKELINNNTNDLNENSYISTKCNVIIGKSSGSYTFSLVKENLLDSKKIFVVFCYDNNTGVWYPEAKSTTIHSFCSKTDDVLNIISKGIDNYKAKA